MSSTVEISWTKWNTRSSRSHSPSGIGTIAHWQMRFLSLFLSPSPSVWCTFNIGVHQPSRFAQRRYHPLSPWPDTWKDVFLQLRGQEWGWLLIEESEALTNHGMLPSQKVRAQQGPGDGLLQGNAMQNQHGKCDEDITKNAVERKKTSFLRKCILSIHEFWPPSNPNFATDHSRVIAGYPAEPGPWRETTWRERGSHGWRPLE